MSATARVDDVLAILMPIVTLNAVAHVDDAHRRARSSRHQLTRSVTAGVRPCPGKSFFVDVQRGGGRDGSHARLSSGALSRPRRFNRRDADLIHATDRNHATSSRRKGSAPNRVYQPDLSPSTSPYSSHSPSPRSERMDPCFKLAFERMLSCVALARFGRDLLVALLTAMGAIAVRSNPQWGRQT